MTVEDLRRKLEGLALDEARAATQALEDGRHEDARDCFRSGEVLLEARAVLAKCRPAQRALTEAEKRQGAAMVDSAIRNAKAGEAVPCPDCNRKDGSKCNPGA